MHARRMGHFPAKCAPTPLNFSPQLRIQVRWLRPGPAIAGSQTVAEAAAVSLSGWPEAGARWWERSLTCVGTC